MTCHEAQDLVEAVAAGDGAAPPAFTEHLAGCRDCALALELARDVERTLAMQAQPSAPADFTRVVAGAIRRGRWEYDEHIDRAFNVAITVGICLIVVAIVGLLNMSALAQLLIAAGDTVAALPRWAPASTDVPALPTAGISTAIVLTGIAVWWWAERRAGYQGQGPLER